MVDWMKKSDLITIAEYYLDTSSKAVLKDEDLSEDLTPNDVDEAMAWMLDTILDRISNL